LLSFDAHLTHLIAHSLRVEGGKFSTFRSTTECHIAGLNLVKIVLLRSEDRARAGYTNPTDEGSSGEAIMLHAVKSDKRSSATESSLAMDGNCAFFLLYFLHEALGNIIWRSRSIDELEVEML